MHWLFHVVWIEVKPKEARLEVPTPHSPNASKIEGKGKLKLAGVSLDSYCLCFLRVNLLSRGGLKPGRDIV